MERKLKKLGYDVFTAENGKVACEQAMAHLPDIILLDVKMPGMDGNQTLKAIKDQFPLTEVIMLTGHATVDSAIDGLKSGAWDYLMKPADIEEIIDKAEQAFGKRMRQEEKIRAAQARKYVKSPREILKET